MAGLRLAGLWLPVLGKYGSEALHPPSLTQLLTNPWVSGFLNVAFRPGQEVTNINIAPDNKTAVSIFNRKKETYKTLEGKYAVFILEGKHNLKKM